MKYTCLLKVFKDPGDECHIKYTDKTPKPAFFHCRITQVDGNPAVCLPVWLG